MAIEFRPDLKVKIDVFCENSSLVIRISDHGRNTAIPSAPAPDLEAKLTGKQSPRGWGLFLIENMVDEMRVSADESGHTIELVVRLG